MECKYSKYKEMISCRLGRFMAVPVVLFCLVVSLSANAATDDNGPLSLQFVCSSDNNNATLKTKEIDKYFNTPSAAMINEIVESTNCHVGGRGLIVGSVSAPGSLTFSLKQQYRKDICRIFLEYVPFEFQNEQVSVCGSDYHSLSWETPGETYTEIFELDGYNEISISVASAEKICLVAMTIVYSDSEAAKGEVTSIQVPLSSRTLNIGAQSQIQSIVMPEYALDRSLIYESDNSGVATVDEEGMIRAIAKGQANIYVRSKSTPSVFAIATVNVDEIKPTSIASAVKGPQPLGVGGRLHLELTFEPSDASKEVVWSTTFGEYIDLDQNGTVTGLQAYPTLNVCATSKVDESIRGYCVLNVVDRLDVSSITVSPLNASLEVGGKMRLNADVLPLGASNRDVEWTTTDSSIATVDANGLVTAIGPGKCLISAAACDGSVVSGSCTVTVDNMNLSSIESAPENDDENEVILCGGSTVKIISSQTDAVLSISDIYGRIYYLGNLQRGESTVTLPGRGIYIILIGKSKYKVAVGA